MFNFTHPTEAPPRSSSWIPHVPGFLQPFLGAILLISLLYLKMMVDLSPVLTPLGRILGPVWRFLVRMVVKTIVSNSGFAAACAEPETIPFEY
jgi:hypothetical protein